LRSQKDKPRSAGLLTEPLFVFLMQAVCASPPYLGPEPPTRTPFGALSLHYPLLPWKTGYSLRLSLAALLSHEIRLKCSILPPGLHPPNQQQPCPGDLLLRRAIIPVSASFSRVSISHLLVGKRIITCLCSPGRDVPLAAVFLWSQSDPLVRFANVFSSIPLVRTSVPLLECFK